MRIRKSVVRYTGGSLLALGISVGCGLLVLGCSGGGGGGGGGGVSNKAISGTLTTLTTSMASRSTNLNTAVTQGTIGSPTAVSPSGSDAAVALGGATNDGTATSVTVTRTRTTNANGSSTFVVSVTETGSGFEFVNATVTLNEPSISYRQAPLSYDALAADGTGRSFVIARIVESGSVSSTFTNTSLGGSTLVDFTGVTPAQVDGTNSGNFSAASEYLFEYSITNLGGTLTAELIDIHGWSDEFIFRRNGGPTTNQLAFNVTSLAVGGGALNGNDTNLAIAVGTDAGSAGVADGASLAAAFTVSGGVTGATLETDVEGDVVPLLNDSPATSISYGGALSVLGTPPVSDGGYDTDAEIEIDSSSEENPTTSGNLDSTIDDLLGDFEDLEDLIYLPSQTSVERSYRLIH